MQNKGTIIFLAYHFPPNISSVAGVRGGNLALELAKNGWQVKVITPAAEILSKTDPIGLPIPQHDNLQIIPTKHDLPELAHWWVKERQGLLPKVFGKLGRGFFQLFNLDQSFGWNKYVLEAASKFNPGEVKLVLASGCPYISFKLAAQIAKRLACPYVLDYRDLWSNDPHHKVRNPFIIQREKRLLKNCAAAVVVADGMQPDLQKLAPGIKVKTISNGYSPEQLTGIEANKFNEPAFVYTGRFMPPLSTVEPIIAALNILDKLAPSKLWKFHYYGQNNTAVETAAEKAQLQHRVVAHGTVTREESLSAIKGARGAFVVTSNSQHAGAAERGILTGKIFEPIGLGCPVICLTPEDSEARHLIERTSTGAAFWSGESEAIANYLAQLLSGSTKTGDGTICSWPVLGKQYSDLLEEVLR